MLDEELEVATRLAKQAGALLMDIYATDFDVHFKKGSDPVTEADRMANAFLVASLREAFPQDAIVAEENAAGDNSKQAMQHAKRCWYVDPLDGTKEYVARNGEFSVMVGLTIDQEARLGVVYKPEGDVLYQGTVTRAGQDDGVATRWHRGEASALRVSDAKDPSSLRLVVSRSHRSHDTDDLVQRLGITQERKSGSVGLKVGLIAEQQADLYVHLSSKSSAWDACAPEAILRAAGGSFRDLQGDPFVYNGESMANERGILACNAACLGEVLPSVREVAVKAGLLTP